MLYGTPLLHDGACVGLNELSEFVDAVVGLVAANLYPGVFVAALVETIFPPIPSEAVFPLAGYTVLQNNMGIFHAIGVGIVGGLGATVGNIIIYLVVLWLGRDVIVRYLKKIRLDEKKIRRSEAWFSRYGDKSVLFGRLVPGIRSLVSIPAAFFRMRFSKFIVYTIVGSCAWSIALTLVGYYLGVATIDII